MISVRTVLLECSPARASGASAERLEPLIRTAEDSLHPSTYGGVVLRWFRNGGSTAGDVVLATGALAAVLAAMLFARLNGWYPEDGSSYVLAVCLAAVAWPASRLAPRSTLAVVAVIVSLPSWSFGVPELRLAPLVVAAFGAAMRAVPVVFTLPVTAVAAAAGILHIPLVYWQLFPQDGVLAFAELRDPSRHVLVAVVLAGVVVLGYAIRAQRDVAHDLRERNAELLALQEVERARVAAEVRTVIARDVHDVVAHHVTAMVIRAQAAERVGSGDPRELRQTLHEIAADGSDALTAMRRVVRMMRSDAETTPLSSADLDAEFDDIIGRVRASGRAVEVSGSAAGGTDFVRATLLRIAQEALTNVLLHSDAQRVTVEFSSIDDLVGATVTDDGTPSTQVLASPGGNGIVGMVERASAAGGTLAAGPNPTGGWRVSASLPRSGRAEKGTS